MNINSMPTLKRLQSVVKWVSRIYIVKWIEAWLVLQPLIQNTLFC
jgi:hypothetical protein